jgi:histone deacetylase complex regulatory component SIN3
MFREVFNEDFSSLPQGSENFKFKTKNQYEEVLFRVEDEMYKQDYELGLLHRTMRVLEVETNIIEQMTEQERGQYKLDPQKFNRVRIRTIEKVYGDMGR